MAADLLPTRAHDLKTWREYFDAVLSGAKTFEIRKDDRGFRVGDTLLLREWNPPLTLHGSTLDVGGYTGRTTTRVVSYMTDFAQRPGYVVLGFAPPLAAPAPSAMATGEAKGGYACGACGHRTAWTYYQTCPKCGAMGQCRYASGLIVGPTPPAAPAAVTEAMVEAALRAETRTLEQIDRENREVGKPYADGSDDRERMRAAIQAALAAAASAERGE